MYHLLLDVRLNKTTNNKSYKNLPTKISALVLSFDKHLNSQQSCVFTNNLVILRQLYIKKFKVYTKQVICANSLIQVIY